MKKRSHLAIVMTIALGLAVCNQTPTTNKDTTTGSSTAASTLMNHDEHMNHMASASASASGQPAHIMAYMDMMGKMHHDMAKGVQAKNADVGFAQGMIPHHQGAIEMASIELKYGKNAEMKALAQTIIDTQQAEIKFMQEWLAKKGVK